LKQRKKRAYDKFDQIKKLEGRIDYLEGVIYQLFQLTEKLLETVKSSRTTKRHGNPPIPN
jgi:hypothetical protein